MDESTTATPTGSGVALAGVAASDATEPGAPAVAVSAWLPGTLDHGFPVDASDEG